MGARPLDNGSLIEAWHLVPISQIGGKICVQGFLPVNLKSNLGFMGLS